jgi:hypothetical protein
VNTYIFAS